MLIASLAERIGELTGEAFAPAQSGHVGGGCVNQALQLSDGRRRFFVKLNQPGLAPMFAAEGQGLQALLAAGSGFRVPVPLDWGVLQGQAYLILEHVEFAAARADGARVAGACLAALHDCCEARGRYGFGGDNYIGDTPQPNGWLADWASFWQQHRLGFQLRLGQARGGLPQAMARRGEQLMQRLPELIGHAPAASLLHGDLWGGNLSYDLQGVPVIYDPAAYYGDAEADLAMTELFGGFSRDFYAVYREQRPLAAEYPVRKTLYNLYHILNHYNMFGGGYLAQADRMMQQVLAHLG